MIKLSIKRIVSLTLALVMTLGMINVNMFTVYAAEGDNWELGCNTNHETTYYKCNETNNSGNSTYEHSSWCDRSVIQCTSCRLEDNDWVTVLKQCGERVNIYYTGAPRKCSYCNRSILSGNAQYACGGQITYDAHTHTAESTTTIDGIDVRETASGCYDAVYKHTEPHTGSPITGGGCYTEFVGDRVVSFEYTGEVPAGETAPETISSKANVEVELTTPTEVRGYLFEGWKSNDITITNNKFNMPDKDITVKGNWIEICLCVLGKPIVSDCIENIGTATGKELDLNALNIIAEYITTDCGIHDETGDVPVVLSIVSQSGGTATLVDGILQVDGIDTLAKVVIKAKATKNSLTTESEFSVTLTRSKKAPIINSWSYNETNSELTLVISPNGHATGDIYIDGKNVSKVTFRKILWMYVDTTCKIKVTDTRQPNTVNSITAKRTADNKKVVITWVDGLDQDNFKDVYVAGSNNQVSEIKKVNIKSPSTTKTINLDYTGNTNPIRELASKQTENSITIDIASLHWNSKLSINSFDKALNQSGEVIFSIPNSLIYNPTIVNDIINVNEGQSITILAKENDTQDPAFPIQTIKSIELIDGKGNASIMDSAQLTDIVEGVEGLVVTFLSEDGYTGVTKLKYTYTTPREDIPEAFGYIDITTVVRNQEPKAVDDGTNITDGLNAQGGTVINIDASLLLDNDLDRESKESLVISSVRNVNSGSIALVDGGRTIRVTAAKVFYGILTFEYRVSDGELLSNSWATVKINVRKVPNPPVAMEVITSMSLDETNKAVSLKVDNIGGEAYQLENSFTAYVNGLPATSQHGITLLAATIEDEDGLTPYIKLNLKKSSTIKDKDVISFNYRVFNVYGSSTSKITINVTSGDDPLDMEGYLYVHRKPIASFAPKITMNRTKTFIDSVTISAASEFSYDLDHQGSHNPANPIKSSVSESYTDAVRPDYSYAGLRSWEWGVKTISGNWSTRVFDAEGINASDIKSLQDWKTADEARRQGLYWIQSETTALINKLKATGNYESVIVSLRVRDIDGDKNLGVWSDQRTILLTSLSLPPVALFQLDKSTYAVPDTMFRMQVTDMSYDPNGDDLKDWLWELSDAKGTKLWSATYNGDPHKSGEYAATNISNTIEGIVRNPSWSPEVPQFKLSLTVAEKTVPALKSDKYSVTFTVYKENKAPSINDNSTNLSLEGSTLYEEDNAADGVKGDNWGTESNTVKPGKMDFSKVFKITDDQPINLLRLSWLFEGESIQKRKDWSEDRRVTTQFAKSNLTYSPFQQPFTGTVTANKFKPGAYRISVSVKDNPSGNAFPDNASQTSYWATKGDVKPFHLYVVPKLDMFAHVEFNGWILSGKFDAAGNWVDTSIRIEDGKTLAEAGLVFEDIAPTIGDTLDIKMKTNQYVTGLWGYEDEDENKKYTVGEFKYEFERVAVNMDGTKEYTGEYTINDIEDAPTGKEFTTLKLGVYGETNWGSEVEAVTRTKDIALPVQVLPVKLFDFRVTSLTDPSLASGFKGYINRLISDNDKLNNGDKTDGVLVKSLAVDRNSNNENVSLMKKGYSFYFSVSSKGLTKDSDSVTIEPRIFAIKDGEIIEELIGCVPNSFGKYKEYTTTTSSDDINKAYSLWYEGGKTHNLGYHHKLTIPTSLRDISGSDQTWHGRYGIPGDAKFFYKRDFEAFGPSSDIEWKGDAIVVFNIAARKDGKSRYNYVERGQWLKEKDNATNSVYAMQEKIWADNKEWLGSVLVFDTNKSIRDDYTSNPVWAE